ncbi:hypothetical protein [Azospirillum sp. TSO22-1]|nr:hypothetical protein [Azospirillum sp. TSO22-1]
MAKERKRGNREVRKPKQKKELVAVSAATLKGLLPSAATPKKKT